VKRIATDCGPGTREKLEAGEMLLLSGPVMACRDRAHRRMAELLSRGMELPFDPEGAALFYAAPTPAPPGRVCGALGPTTSLRMDPFTPPLVAAGVRMFIGKGPRTPLIESTMAAAGALYLAAAGGTAALGGGCVDSCVVAAWEDLGAEALYRIVLRDYPVFVALDLHGGNLFEMRMRK